MQIPTMIAALMLRNIIRPALSGRRREVPRETDIKICLIVLADSLKKLCSPRSSKVPSMLLLSMSFLSSIAVLSA